MPDLIITAVGSAEIPIEGLGKKHRIVQIKTVDKGGETKDVGFFSLMDLLRALNARDNEPVTVQEARFAGKLTF
jgi:hypothetical protein